MSQTFINKGILYENMWGNMTNPINKKTKEQFLQEIPKNLGIEIIGEYINTDTKIKWMGR